MRVTAPGYGDVFVPHDSGSWTNDEVVVDVWGHSYVGVTAASAIDQALGGVIGMPCLLRPFARDAFALDVMSPSTTIRHPHYQ